MISISGQRATLSSWLWGSTTLVALVVLVPSLLLIQASTESLRLSFELPTILALLSVVYSGIHLAALAMGRETRLLNLTFWIFVYVWMGLGPLVQLAASEFPWPGGYNDPVLVYSTAIVLLGLLCYDLGNVIGNTVVASDEGYRSFGYGFTLSKRRVYLLSFLAVVLAVISIQQLGGLGSVVGTRYSYSEVSATFEQSAGLVWTTLLRIPSFAALALCWWVWIDREHLLRRTSEKQWHLVVLALLALVNLVTNYPPALARYLFGTYILGLIFMSVRRNRRHSSGVFIAGLLVLLLIVFPYTDIFRTEEIQITVAPVALNLANPDYDAFQQLVNTLVFVSGEGITWGNQLLGALLFWFPRDLWLDKPVGSGALVAEYIGYDFTRLSSPLWAESYINAGLIGVILVFVLYGMGTALLQKAYAGSSGTRSSLLGALVPILAAYQIFFLRGALISAVAYLVPLLLYFLAAGRITPADKPKRNE